ncbi:hypothetical protein HPB47_012741 [Ixodes persulcatus]|uniref:Uncharacterized protein n=1 Tax=Ixodes persulcatus TaxID=34615 RepID=A0AC60NSP6_IXOPE|nr:hypothetical protein HPB47_012741 [Ixodes persulcatus]
MDAPCPSSSTNPTSSQASSDPVTLSKPPFQVRTVLTAAGVMLFAVLATGSVVYATQYVVNAQLAKNMRMREALRDIMGSHEDDVYGVPRPRSPFIFACETEQCSREGSHLRRNVAWDLNPCLDFHEYACSGDSQRRFLREDAVEHFLGEIRQVVRKWTQLRWLQKTSLQAKVTRYFQACQSSYADPDNLHHHLGKYLASVDQHRRPEAWVAEVSKTLQIFPIVDISVSTLDDRKCIVLREPDVLDSDAVLGVPGIASENYKDFVLKLMKGREDRVDDIINLAWELRTFVGAPDDPLKPLKEFKTQTVKELQQEYPMWHWDRFLSAFFLDSLTVDEKTCVVVRSPSYLRHVAEVVHRAKPDTIKPYCSYAVHLHLWPHWKLAENSEMGCSLLTYRLFNYAFVSHFNLTERLGVLGKAGIKEAIIRNSFRHALSTSSALPYDMKESVLDMMASTRRSYFNSMDDVDAYYEPAYSVVLNRRNILATYIGIKHSLTQNWLAKVVFSGGLVHDTNLDLVCHYDPDHRVLAIPMSIAEVDVGGREFFLDSSTVGLLLARSLYRIFQDPSMWSPDLQAYRSCFEDQYNAAHVSNESVNGARSLRSNMMDSVALDVLHKAFRSAVQFYSLQTKGRAQLQEVRLHFPDLPAVSSEQIFFLMYAQSFCEPREDVARVLSKSCWAPAKVRLNVPLSNFDPFAEAFFCASGSPMNPKSKCRAL